MVERAIWIEEGFNGQSSAIQISLSVFSPERVSFTYPDSMISYWLRNQTDEEFYHPEYHGQVFVLSEICRVIDKFGVPGEEWRTDGTRKYDLFIEAQVWDSPLKTVNNPAQQVKCSRLTDEPTVNSAISATADLDR